MARYLWILALELAFAVNAMASAPLFRVVIDPGHGGNDQGAIYQGRNGIVAEKDITLSLAKQIARMLREHGMSAILTRNTDKEVPLQDRTGLANRLGADVFLSIHMNSTPARSLGGAQGTETYILNHTTDAPSKRLAYLENRLLAPELAQSAHSTGDADVALILKDLQLDANLSESKRLACAIQNSLVAAHPVRASAGDSGPPVQPRNRGVKQALFYVLLGADMPSVLVEAGFINHPRDRSWVLSPEGSRAISASIAKAVDTFRRSRGSLQARSMLSTCKVN